MTVRPGCLEGFKKQAAEFIRITQEKDTHTLRYDWFLSIDGTECEVREAYTGPEGLIEHNRNILEARTKLFKDYADDHFMTFYGELSEPLLDLLKAHSVGFKWFSFLQGLEPSPVIPQPARLLWGQAMKTTTFDMKVHDFLAQKRIAVAGVSRNNSHHPTGNLIYRRLKKTGHEVFPVNPHMQTFEGDRCYPEPAVHPGRSRRRGDRHAT